MVKSKLSMGIIISVALVAAGIGLFYSSEFVQPTQPTQPANVHHFQVKVNDTFVIGEKHG